ncbi:DUF1656 domain-containing protein [Ancylobacter sp. VNQ12]|uniref:DUF1656 domain-containing protein n=1 Tax=Ancylobacter sp. VNQ12 TaxID=3400920 RepID=UPI003C0F3601
MLAEIDLFGIFVPTFLLLALAAMLVTRIVSRLLDRLRIGPLIWHRALFDLAVFVLVAGAAYYVLERLT